MLRRVRQRSVGEFVRVRHGQSDFELVFGEFVCCSVSQFVAPCAAVLGRRLLCARVRFRLDFFRFSSFSFGDCRRVTRAILRVSPSSIGVFFRVSPCAARCASVFGRRFLLRDFVC